jgi:sensor c-di-GMP phosphodiesterase-like protein
VIVKGTFWILNLWVLCRLGILIGAAVLGGFLTYRIGDTVEYRLEQANLVAYASRLVDHGQQLGKEAGESIRAISDGDHVPCSDRDVAFMRNLVVSSEHLRDAGRIHDGMMECSALLGRFSPAEPVPPPDITSEHAQASVAPGQWHTWTSSWPIMPSSFHGHYIETRGVWVAINEQTLRDQEEPPPRIATELLFDRHNRRMLPAFGPDVPLTLDEIVAGRLIERRGVLYQPFCRSSTIVCAIASEPVSVILATSRTVLLLRIGFGAFLGMLLASLAILFDFRRQSLEAQLRKAISTGALSLVYQPIVDLETEKITGAEALVRWIKRDGESIPPDVFVALAEAEGFVCEITRLVMHRIVQELGDVLVQGRLHLTLNVTAQDLTDPTFLPELDRCLQYAKVPRSALGLELTERSTADSIVATKALSDLKQAGYRLYIDDFGTGYSSLAYLHRLAVDGIKIDQIFTQTVGTESITATVIPQILEMARQLELQVIVEGVETKEQADYFRAAFPTGRAQGWLYSRPLSANDLRRLL